MNAPYSKEALSDLFYWNAFLKNAFKGSEAVVQRCSVKKLFLEISQNLQENTCGRASFLMKLQVFSCKFCEISKNTFSSRTPLVAASKGYTTTKPNTEKKILQVSNKSSIIILQVSNKSSIIICEGAQSKN